MKLLISRTFWGVVLVLGGILLLLESLDIFHGDEIFWMAFCGVVGLLFLAVLITNRWAWWAVIPGVILLSITTTIGLATFTTLPGSISGAIMLGGIGLSFFLVYLIQRIHWWALIPGGVMGTFAVVSLLSNGTTEYLTGTVFFFGLGLTFVMVAILPNPIGRMYWAWIPAVVLLLLAAVLLAGVESLINYIWPIALLLAGLFLIWRSFRDGK
jgi:hypothetical protein